MVQFGRPEFLCVSIQTLCCLLPCHAIQRFMSAVNNPIGLWPRALVTGCRLTIGVRGQHAEGVAEGKERPHRRSPVAASRLVDGGQPAPNSLANRQREGQHRAAGRGERTADHRRHVRTAGLLNNHSEQLQCGLSTAGGRQQNQHTRH